MSNNSTRMHFEHNVYHSISIVLYGDTVDAPPARELDAVILNVLNQYGPPGTYREWQLSERAVDAFMSRVSLSVREMESVLSLCEASPEDALDMVERIESALGHRIDPSLTVQVPLPAEGVDPTGLSAVEAYESGFRDVVPEKGSLGRLVREIKLSLNPQYTAVLMNTTSSRFL